MKLALAAALACAALPVASARAEDPGPFSKFFGPGAPECVAVSDIRSIGSMIALTPEQFQFARALFVAIPPISRELPPGDHAMIAISGNVAMIAIADENQSCARFIAPDFVLSMLMKVGEGEIGKVGQAM